MADMQTFKKTFREHINDYEFLDKERLYTNGSWLIQSFRVLQGWDHYMDQFRNAYNYSNGDVHVFGHCCKKILKDMGEL